MPKSKVQIARGGKQLPATPAVYPSVNDTMPDEEGGPTARVGFNYQDEIAVGFLIEMLDDPSLVKIHCETHDDILAVRSAGSGKAIAEYIQVKAHETDKLWSVSDICVRKKGRIGTSIYETSLGRDKHKEISLFRIVTLRPVNQDLRVLTYPRSSPARSKTDPNLIALIAALKKRFPEATSAKKNDASFWVCNCIWDEKYSEVASRKDNLLRMIKLGAKEGRTLLPEQAEGLLNELRSKTKDAGDAKWRPDKSKKIIDRIELRKWWEKRFAEITKGASTISGGKLAGKMHDALIPDDLLELAKELRRDYSARSRAPRYTLSTEDDDLRSKVKATVMSLRSSLVCGELDVSGVEFHNLCLKEMEKINRNRPEGSPDRSAFVKGCMYDIADRCMLRFARPS
jgi:hypothetical protein